MFALVFMFLPKISSTPASTFFAGIGIGVGEGRGGNDGIEGFLAIGSFGGVVDFLACDWSEVRTSDVVEVALDG